MGAIAGAAFMPNVFTVAFGAIMGWGFDLTAGADRRRHALLQLNQDLCINFIRLAASVAAVGRSPQLAWQALRPALEGDTANLALAEQQFHLALRQTFDLDVLARTIIAQVDGNPKQLAMFVEVFADMARRQGASPTQQRLLGRLAEFFDVDLPLYGEEAPPRVNHHAAPDDDAEPEIDDTPPPPLKTDALGDRNPFFVLGLSSDATLAQIKSAYRKLVAQHHPDRLRGQGASAKTMKEAEEKMRVYNAAYDMLAKRQKE